MASVGFINKIIGLAVLCAAVGAVVLAWHYHTTAPEISLLVLGCLCVLALAGAIVALWLAARAQKDATNLSLQFESAIDRLELRHDGDHARLVMTLAALDARSSGRQIENNEVKSSRIINNIDVPLLKNTDLSNDDFQGRRRGDNSAKAHAASEERALADVLATGKLRLSLEPIFKMPSAEVRGYLAYAHLEGRNTRRVPANSTANNADFDYQLLFAAAKAARQILSSVPHRSQVFCSLGKASLHEPKSLNAIFSLFEAQPTLKEALVLLASARDLQGAAGTTFDRMRRDGIHLAIEGMPESLDLLRHFDGGYWFVNAPDITAMTIAEFTQKYRQNSEIYNLTLIALEGGDEAQLVELIDLNVELVTSHQLSPPREVRGG